MYVEHSHVRRGKITKHKKVLTIGSSVEEAIPRAVVEEHPPPPLRVPLVLRAVPVRVDGAGVVAAMLKLHQDALAESGPAAAVPRAERGGGGEREWWMRFKKIYI